MEGQIKYVNWSIIIGVTRMFDEELPLDKTQSLEEYKQEVEKAKQYYEKEARSYKLDMQEKIQKKDMLLIDY